MAAPIVGENSIGIRFSWRSFQAATIRSASSSNWASVASFLIRGAATLVLHLASIKAHVGRVDGRASFCQAERLETNSFSVAGQPASSMTMAPRNSAEIAEFNASHDILTLS
jgi:hypothetical protein